MIPVSKLLSLVTAAFFCAALLMANSIPGRFPDSSAISRAPSYPAPPWSRPTKARRSCIARSPVPRAITFSRNWWSGAYMIAIEARGFKRYVKTGIALNAEAKLSADVD